MKITCEKGYDARKVLQFVTEYIEKKSLEYPLLAENMEIEISLEGKDGKACPENGERIYFGKSELCFAQSMDRVSADYYNRDVLTGLYARNKYERDLNLFQATGYTSLICVYIDAVGLHEINNHLGHDTGDYMLRCVADGIRTHFPKSMSYRIGGDEFVILA